MRHDTSLHCVRFPFRTGLQHTTTIVPGGTSHIPLTVPTVPEVLKTGGYSTHMLGKWHLGYAKWAFTPIRRGFDSYFGYLQGQEDYYNKTLGWKFGSGYDFWEDDQVHYGVKGGYSLDQYMERFRLTLDQYVAAYPSGKAQQEHPLFVYMAHQTIHVPLEARSDEKACSKITEKWRKVYCCMMIELDAALKDMVDSLQGHGLWNDTLLLLTTDNGGMVRYAVDKNGVPSWPASVGSNFPLRGSKVSLFEGGVRGTGVVNGGDNVMLNFGARGSSYAGLMHAVDFAGICIGVSQADSAVTLAKDDGSAIDGINLLPAIIRQPQSQASLPKRDNVPLNINYGGRDFTAVRFGKWKLFFGKPFVLVGQNGWSPQNGGALEKGNWSCGHLHLFDIEKDPVERHELLHNSKGAYKEVVKQGVKILAKYMLRYRKPQPNLIHPRGLPIFHNQTWAPFLHDEDESYVAEQHKSIHPPEQFLYL